ncbi:MAG: ASCH domain-containing protein [Pseudonocardiaceae bacterium]
MTARPAHLPTRAHEMGIYKRYFDLIASGRKTTEIRVNDSRRCKITEGSLIRFRCREEEVLTRVARYRSFSASSWSTHPDSSHGHRRCSLCSSPGAAFLVGSRWHLLW